MQENFVAINLIDKDHKSLFDFPIIYYWDGNGNIEDSLLEETFIKYISSKITLQNFHSSTINLIYTFMNENEEIMYHQDKFEIKNIYNLDTFDLKKNYLWEIMNFLYKCAYKEDFNNIYNFKDLYKELLKKYPKKINENVVSNFIQSKLKETYKEMSDSDIQLILEKFYEEIQ